MGTATFELVKAAHTAPRRFYGLIVAFNLTRGPGFPPGGDAEPRAESALTPPGTAPRPHADDAS